jgi:hypothetical protein
VSVDGPFSAPSEVRVGGGTTVSLEVTFSPAAVGPATGTVHVDLGGSHLDALLAGNALPVPDCGQAPACHARTFDPDSGNCVDSPVADGADCASSNLCLDHPSCRGGECVGPAVDCDDHNVCTSDACDPARGCTHADAANACPAPSDPCFVATCDATLGCSSAPAADGTICGSVDCVTAHVCLLGTCQAVQVPDGTECAPATPCRAEGTCQAGTCTLPDPTQLQARWSYHLDGGYLAYSGATDDQGNLFWAECGDTCSLVSATRDGFVRYRAPMQGMAPLYGQGYGVRGRFGVFGDQVVILTQDYALESHWAVDGGPAWRDTLDQLAPDAGVLEDGGPTGIWTAQGAFASPGGEVQLVAYFNPYYGPDVYAVPDLYLSVQVSLDAATGTRHRVTPFAGMLQAPLGDEAGHSWSYGWTEPLPDGGSVQP